MCALCALYVKVTRAIYSVCTDNEYVYGGK